MDLKKYPVLVALFLFGLVARAIDFSRININWQYDPTAEVRVNHRVVQEDDLITVFLRLRSDSVSKWNLKWQLQEDYDSETDRAFSDIEVNTIHRKDKSVLMRAQFSRPEEDLLVLILSKNDVEYFYDVPLKSGSLPFPSIYPVNNEGVPILANYVTTSSLSWVGGSSYYATGYRENFPPADPPMADMKPIAPSISPDTSFTFTSPVAFESDYFYKVKTDSTENIGVTLLKAYPYFPEFKRLKELVSAMHYLLNEAEQKGIKGSKNLKQSFDSFWLNTYETKFRARNAIRNYYNWVEQANYLFTDFKQGWKTDRGMLFIIYGVPDEVYRTGNTEEWYYDNGPAFEFTVISTFFSSRTYALRRRVEYESSWFEYKAAIRRGSNE